MYFHDSREPPMKLADASYTTTSEDISKLSFVDSTDAANKAALGNLTYNYGLEKDGSDSSIIQNEIANHA